MQLTLHQTHLNILLNPDLTKSSGATPLWCAFAARGSVAIFSKRSGENPEEKHSSLKSDRAHHINTLSIMYETASRAAPRSIDWSKPISPIRVSCRKTKPHQRFSRMWHERRVSFSSEHALGDVACCTSIMRGSSQGPRALRSLLSLCCLSSLDLPHVNKQGKNSV